MTTPILFISGAGLPAWIWDEVGSEVESETAIAGAPSSSDARLSDYAVAALDSAPWDKFVVVAHSSGGVIASELVTQAPDRVAGLLGVSAVIPAPGRSFVSSMPFPNRVVLPIALKLAGTKPPEKAIRAGVASGVDKATADRIVSEFRPESRHLFLTRTGTKRFPQSGYLFTENDRELPEKVQATMANNVGASWKQSLRTGHLPMLEQPSETAAAIQSFAIQLH